MDKQKPHVSNFVNAQNLDVCKEQRKYAAQMMLLFVQMSLYEARLLESLRLEVLQKQTLRPRLGLLRGEGELGQLQGLIREPHGEYLLH